MTSAGSDARGWRWEAPYGNWGEAGRPRAVAKLAYGVLTPASNGPVQQERACEATPGSDVCRRHAQVVSHDSLQAGGRRTVAELSEYVATPACNAAALEQNARVKLARFDDHSVAATPRNGVAGPSAAFAGVTSIMFPAIILAGIVSGGVCAASIAGVRAAVNRFDGCVPPTALGHRRIDAEPVGAGSEGDTSRQIE